MTSTARDERRWPYIQSFCFLGQPRLGIEQKSKSISANGIGRVPGPARQTERPLPLGAWLPAPW
jgi:hypothetical protein